MTHQDCRERRRSRERRVEPRRSPLFARLVVNSILYGDTICLKQ